MGGNSQRQPGREPQRQPPETAPPALPDHHHPQTHQTPLHPPHQPPTPTPPITQLHQPNPATQPPLQPHQPQHHPAAETQKGNTPNNTKMQSLGTPNCKNVGGPLGAKQLKMPYKGVHSTEHNNPAHPCNTEKPTSKTTKHTVGHTQTKPQKSSDCQTQGKILQIWKWRAHRPQGFSLFSGIYLNLKKEK